MRLNFWQWLGLICLILGLAGVLFFRTQDSTGPSTVPIAPAVDDDLPEDGDAEADAGPTTQPGEPATATP